MQPVLSGHFVGCKNQVVDKQDFVFGLLFDARLVQISVKF
jgi:hypothetical protein